MMDEKNGQILFDYKRANEYCELKKEYNKLKKEYFNVGVDGNMLTSSSAAWLTKNNLLNSTLINKLT